MFIIKNNPHGKGLILLELYKELQELNSHISHLKGKRFILNEYRYGIPLFSETDKDNVINSLNQNIERRKKLLAQMKLLGYEEICEKNN